MKNIILAILCLMPSFLWANQNFETFSHHVVISEINRSGVYWIVQPQISQNDLKHIKQPFSISIEKEDQESKWLKNT